MFDVFDHIPSDSISPKKLEELQGHIAEIRKRGLWFIQQYLVKQLLSEGNAHGLVMSDANIDLGYDFILEATATRSISAKSTDGGFDMPIHISYNELLQMRETPHFDLYRVYEIGEKQAFLRIARDTKGFAESLLNVLEKLPEGVRPDSVSISPQILDFESPIRIEATAQEE